MFKKWVADVNRILSVVFGTEITVERDVESQSEELICCQGNEGRGSRVETLPWSETPNTMFVIRRLNCTPSTDEYCWVYVMEDAATDFGYTWTSTFKDSTKYSSMRNADRSIRELMIDHAYTLLDVIPVTILEEIIYDDSNSST